MYNQYNWDIYIFLTKYYKTLYHEGIPPLNLDNLLNLASPAKFSGNHPPGDVPTGNGNCLLNVNKSTNKVNSELTNVSEKKIPMTLCKGPR